MFIYPHSDPEILKLGIRMALYGEPKPDDEDYKHDAFIERIRKEDYKHVNLIKEYHEEIKLWQKTRIACLKEEFKAAEIIIEIASLRKMEVGVICGDGSFAAAYIENNKSFTRTNKSFSQDSTLISHYCPGQEYDGDVKYLRKVKTEKVIRYGWNVHEWQEVEEPAEDVIIKSSGEKGDIVHDTQWDTNPKYTQFQEGIKKGEILAVLTKPIKS